MIEPADEERLLGLLRGSRRERDRGMRELLERVREPLFGLALRMTGRPDLADDAVQETFLDALGGLKAFRGESRLTTWLFRIAVRAAARVAGRTRVGAEVLPDELHDRTAGPSESAEQVDAANRILRAIASLPPPQRAVVSLTALEELSQVDVAEVLGIPVGTVYSRLHEARARLRERLD